MKQNVKLLTQNCCETLLALSINREKYNHPIWDESNLEFLKIPTNYYLDDSLELGILSKDDCDSSIILFTELGHLDRVQANDKRLWVCLTHTVFFDYTRKRWGIGRDDSNETIISRFHFEGSGIEARMRNSISRLWWTAKITHDPLRKDPFELTKLIWEKQDIHVALMERSFGTYPNFVRTFLEFYKSNKHLVESDIRSIVRGMNSIGGVKMIPLLDGDGINAEIRRVAKYAGIRIN